MEKKIVKRIERVFKGAGNHHRIKIIQYIAEADNTSLWQISEGLDMDFRLASHHTEVLEEAGLIEKKYLGRQVMHFLTPYGERVFEFMTTLAKL